MTATHPTARVLAAALVHVLVALGGLLLTSGLLRANRPRLESVAIELKLAAYAEVADEVDTVFLGASTVYRHVDPALFDTTASMAGRPTRSFNLGADGLTLLEAERVLEEVLEIGAGRLRHVLFEPRRLKVADADSLRFSLWHDARWTLEALRSDDQFSTEGELSAGAHATAFLRRAVNFGQGAELVELARETPAERRARRREWLGPGERGFVTYEWVTRPNAPPSARRRRAVAVKTKFERAQDKFFEVVLDLERLRVAEPTASEEARVLRMQELCAEADVELTLFTSCDVVPDRTVRSMTHSTLLRRLAKEGRIGRFVDLSDRSSYPELYLPQRRFDWLHLDDEGARSFTRSLAAGFAKLGG